MKDKQVHIYRLEFSGGEIYIGKTGNFKARMSVHQTMNSTPEYLKELIISTGWENVVKTILCTSSISHGDKLENFFIIHYRSKGVCVNERGGYNGRGTSITGPMLKSISQVDREEKSKLLTDPKKEIIYLISKGFSEEEISINSEVSEVSVKSQLYQIRNILGARSNAQSVSMCYEMWGFDWKPEKMVKLENQVFYMLRLIKKIDSSEGQLWDSLPITDKRNHLGREVAALIHRLVL